MAGLSRADDDTAENHLVDAAIAYDAQDWDAALAALSRARAEVQTDSLSARIERQAALVLAAVDRPADALEAFRAALRLDPDLTFESWRFGPGVVSLFECAQALEPSHPPVVELRADGRRGWVCPGAGEVEDDALPSTGSSGPSPGVADLDAGAAPPRGTSRFSAAGAIGISLAAVGLAVGGGLAAWQWVESSNNNSRGDALRAEPLAAGAPTAPRIAEINAAYSDAHDQDRNAMIIAIAGGVTAAVGATLLLIDLSTPGEPDPGFGRVTLSGGPGFAAFRLEL